MAQNACLITPRGKRIDLSPEMYGQIKRMLDANSRRRRQSKVDGVIASVYGKYAGGRSLIRALLSERGAERAREDCKTSDGRNTYGHHA